MKVVEIFGPTVQGEGPHAGKVTHFLRLGGCDFRCSWCDTMYAVEPAAVRAAESLDAGEILDRLDDLDPAPMLVLSGGNPALQRLDYLVTDLLARYGTLAVETQGSVWRPWLSDVDSLVVSPKPPSSGMTTPAHWAQFEVFMARTDRHGGRVLKLVVFDADDLEWAAGVHRIFAGVPLYLSAGTDPGDGDQEHAETVVGVGERYGWLCGKVAGDRRLHDAVVLPQLHVIAWGRKVGV